MASLNGERTVFETTTNERDLGVKVSDEFKHRAQINEAASTANRMLGRLRKAFRSRSLQLWRTLYTTYIRPHFEFAIQAWSPHLATDIEILERVQHRAPKVIMSIKHLSYEERLARLGLTTLKARRGEET